MQIYKNNIFYAFAFLFSLSGYIALGYFTERQNFVQLITLFIFLFGIYLLIVQKKEYNFKIFIIGAVGLRISLLFMTPNLSDDFYRFIWDGRLLSHGINPYLILPSSFVKTNNFQAYGVDKWLYENLNSPNYYTVYPPILQFIFFLAAKLSPDNILGAIITMRSFIVAAEIGSLFMMLKLLKKFHLPKERILLYAFNPLVIVELTGNLHFEAVMIFFLLFSILLLTDKKVCLGALALGASIAVKLMPLMFLPYFFKTFSFKRTVLFYALLFVAVLVLFAPFLSQQLFSNFFSSVDLYFHKFEFNASVYYIIRAIGFYFIGYNIIGSAGTALFFAAFLLIILITWKHHFEGFASFFTAMLFILLVFYFLTSIVHPWYITTLVAVSIFTPFRFTLAWSFTVLLSYAAYRSFSYEEDLYLVGLEYLLVLFYIKYDLRKLKNNVPRLVA